MIYEIQIQDLPNALSSGASILIISNDSQYALIESDFEIECIESYKFDQLNTLMQDEKWRQPCKECEV